MADRLELTSGRIPRQLLTLASPIMMGMAAFTLYLVTDLWFIGKLGPDAVAALSISSNVFFIHLGLSFIIGTGGMALIAQAVGAGNHCRTTEVFKQSLVLAVIVGTIVAISGLMVAAPYIRFFGANGRAFVWGVEYFQIYSVSLFFLLLLHVFSACYRGMGNTKTSMFIVLQTLIINIVLDPILIFGLAGFPALGVKGAALASLVSQIYGVLIYIYLVFIKKQHIHLIGPWRLNYKIIRQSLMIGIPSGLAYFLLTANLLITYRVVSPYGTEALAALGIGFRIIQVIYLPTVAISEAMAAMVGQNFGANNYGRIVHTFWTGWCISALIMVAGTIICWLFPSYLIQVFSPNHEVNHYGIIYLRIMSLANWVVGTILTVSAVFQGLGKTYPILICALADNLVFAAIVFTLPVYFGWSVDAVWWIKVITAVMEMCLCAAWLRHHFYRLTPMIKRPLTFGEV